MNELSYLDASHVESPAGALSTLALLTSEGKPFGTIKGVVIEAAARRVRYFDVESGGLLRRRRYLLEADQLAQLESDGSTLRLLADPSESEVTDLNRDELREFCDDDLLAAIFAPRAA